VSERTGSRGGRWTLSVYASGTSKARCCLRTLGPKACRCCRHTGSMPHPYVCADRASVREFVAAQEDAGWVNQTTFYGYHFDRDTQLLTRSGVLHLKWILRSAPAHRRILYVQTADTAKASEVRMTSVRGITEEMVGLENLPPVIPRVTSPIGRSALEVDGIQRGDMGSQPVPRISPAFSGGGAAAP
jgi:hypothetical protein